MIRAAIVLLFILAAVLYLLVLLNEPFIYIFALPVSLLVATFLSLLIVAEIVWRLLQLITKRPLEQSKKTFTTVVVICLAFLVFGGRAMNIYLLPGKFHPLSLFVNALTLLYTGFIGWNLLRGRRQAAVVVVSGVFFLSISIFALFSNSMVSTNKDDRLRNLTSLPYISFSAPDDTLRETGVLTFQDERAFRGINLYASDVSKQAFLMNMLGDVLHTWTCRDLAPEKSLPLSVELYENGDLLVSVADKMLIKLDWHSNVKWKRNTRVHHDMAVAGNGDILSLARKDELRVLHGIPTPILNDYIFVFSPDGEKKREISMFKLLKDRIPLETAKAVCQWIVTPEAVSGCIKRMKTYGYAYEQSTPLDMFHTNALEIIDRDIDGLCKKGNVLLSFRELDLIGILDLQTEELVWTWGPGTISQQHQPTLLANGNILLFDNGVGRGFSRVVELDPVARAVVWTYEADPPEVFYSGRMGSGQRLPGGSTLVTNSESGHVFEITGDGDVVWEFYNPDTDESGERRGVIYRMRRITDPDAYSFPEELEPY